MGLLVGRRPGAGGAVPWRGSIVRFRSWRPAGDVRAVARAIAELLLGRPWEEQASRRRARRDEPPKEIRGPGRRDTRGFWPDVTGRKRVRRVRFRGRRNKWGDPAIDTKAQIRPVIQAVRKVRRVGPEQSRPWVHVGQPWSAKQKGSDGGHRPRAGSASSFRPHGIRQPQGIFSGAAAPTPTRSSSARG